ncbi:MAG: hypothetical protein C4K58_04325 [Flavobacteriaceae bacterium]|nr:MAG: hypothetical protein C4K58_04325 [Flavobacteriaceae bacterium]
MKIFSFKLSTQIALGFLLALNTSLFGQNQTEVEKLKKISQNLDVFQNKPSSARSKQKNNLPKGYQGTLNGMPAVYGTRDLKANNISGITSLQSNTDLSIQPKGEGITLYQWDEGSVLTTHQDFSSNVTNKQTAAANTHSTGVAGMMVSNGVNANSTGTAKNAKLITYDFDDDLTEIALVSSQNPSGMLSNHSYGLYGGWEYNSDPTYYKGIGWYWYGDTSYSETEDGTFGYYSVVDQSTDKILYSAPFHTFIQAVGNPRNDNYTKGSKHYYFKPVKDAQGNITSFEAIESYAIRNLDCESGYDCVGWSSTHKNGIQVGSIDNFSGSFDASKVKLSSYSAIGPTDDGRIKPDLVAVGQGVTIPYATGNTNYATASGTSFSSPLVTGGVGLLQQVHKNKNGAFMTSDMVKALICHSAHDVGNIGPDYQFGFGVFNAYLAAQIIENKSQNAFVLRNNSFAQNSVYTKEFYIIDASAPLKATLAWIDPALETLPDYSVNNRSKILINDLDIRIKDEDGVVISPWVLDVNNPSNPATTGDNNTDNIEQIVLNSPKTYKKYTVEIRSKKGTSTNQSFALVLTAGKICESLEKSSQSQEIDYCQGETLTLNGEAGYTSYLWKDSSGNTVATTQNYSANKKDTYTLIQTKDCIQKSLVFVLGNFKDTDSDGINDKCDNCVNHANSDQKDTDSDGKGDVCDLPDDSDADGILDNVDNCINVYNPLQEDADNNGIGDACDLDTDKDGIIDFFDNCKNTANPDQKDSDGDKIGDACELAINPNDISITSTNESCGNKNGSISISSLDAGQNYTLKINNVDYPTFTGQTKVEGLAAGGYNLCLKKVGTLLETCINHTIQSDATMRVTDSQPAPNKVTLSLEGANNYTIVFNQETITTSQSSYDLTLKPGLNTLKVTGDDVCKTVFEKQYTLVLEDKIFPNPSKDGLVTIVFNANQFAEVSAFDASGKLIRTNRFENPNYTVKLDYSSFPSGVYFIQLKTENTNTTFKLLIQ